MGGGGLPTHQPLPQALEGVPHQPLREDVPQLVFLLNFPQPCTNCANVGGSNPLCRTFPRHYPTSSRQWHCCDCCVRAARALPPTNASRCGLLPAIVMMLPMATGVAAPQTERRSLRMPSGERSAAPVCRLGHLARAEDGWRRKTGGQTTTPQPPSNGHY